MSSLKLFIECIKEVRKTKKAIKQVKEMDLTAEALQQLVNTVAFGGNEVELELKLKDGRSLIFKRKEMGPNSIDSFKDRFNKAHSGRSNLEVWGGEE